MTQRTPLRDWWRDADRDLWIRCPECGFESVIDYEIEDDGEVDPELICPDECGFRADVTLIGYKPGKMQP